MRSINISAECCDGIFRALLSEDYSLVCRNLKELREIVEPEAWQAQDLADHVTYKLAFETLIRYYYEHHEANNIIEKNV